MHAMKGFAAALAFALAACATASAQEQAPLDCPSVMARQGGLLICQSAPGARFELNGEFVVEGDEDGWAVIALSRLAGGAANVRALGAEGSGLTPSSMLSFDVAPQDYPSTRIEGVPRASPSYTPEEVAHIQRSTALKRTAFDTIVPGADWLGGFILPADGRRSGVYGSSRVYNNDDANPRIHWGLDIAAPEGTPVVAPAGGVITLADPDLFFEGGTIFLDHGQGLVSIFMHLSAVHVESGQRVEQGELIGEIGTTGRSTGPHLHWGLKYRDRFYVDPALALELEPVAATDAMTVE